MEFLRQHLQHYISDAQLITSPLPNCPLQLWLIDPRNMQRAFSPEETQALLNNPPYWCFCWASGLALANWLLAHPEQVQGKRVIDFGAGSGIVAIAAAKAGAAQVLACDLDPLALAACQANAQLNQVQLDYCNDLFSLNQPYDVLIAADVLYDASNLPLLDVFGHYASSCLIADSRVRNFKHAQYTKISTLHASTWPDLYEPEEFRQVSLYQRTIR